MNTRSAVLAAGIATLVLSAGMPAQALTMKECSVKYKAAQTAGTLNGMKWNDFRKAECAADTSAAPAATPAAMPAPAAPAPAPAAKPAAAAPAPAAKPVASAPPAATPSNAVFPSAVSPKYSSESAGKARMHTCLDQYKANKTNDGNGGLNWIEKGGGYYSECNKRLKS